MQKILLIKKRNACIMYNDGNYDINEWFGGEILKDNRKIFFLYHKI